MTIAIDPNTTTPTAKPFLKWAGGKRQLLDRIDQFLPTALKQGKIDRYIEPFVGSGAVFFHIAAHYSVKEFAIADVNCELVLTYQSLQKDVESIVSQLLAMKSNYLSLDEQGRKDYFFEVRSQFNHKRRNIDFSQYSTAWSDRAAEILFLNRTCFNGLFRVNSKGEFNVPPGRYKNPKICDPDNLRAVSQLLQRTTIYCGDFSECETWVDDRTFVYFDPPYRPLNPTSNFTAYSRQAFGDREQLQLRDFFRKLDRTGAKLMLSNSDPKNEDPDDNFFDTAYQGYRIERVKANRNINSKGHKRSAIDEILIVND